MQNNLTELIKRVQYNIVTSTTEAGSGHPSSSLSGVEVMVALMFSEEGFFRQDLKNPHAMTNDRFVLSKGHAAPLLYSLYEVAGAVSHDELMSLRKFGSKLEGHPTPEFAFADVTTGSLGQGLSVGLGMALGIKLRNVGFKRTPKVFVMMGDSESAEGQIYEAAQAASYHHADNLVAILDVNRLGQRGPTMLGWDLKTYQKRFESFGWQAIVLEDGHDVVAIQNALKSALTQQNGPVIFILKTKKGHGVSLLEDQDNWHGKPVPKDKLETALKEIGDVDLKLTAGIASPETGDASKGSFAKTDAKKTLFTSPYSTREAYGDALVELGHEDADVVVLDGETGNSTFSEKFQKQFADRYFELFIAEQNMISVALGLSKIGYKPYSSTFAAFLTRAFDQIRMAQYSEPNLNICGSHAGASIGQDGASQMGLEDLSMMRSLLNSTVLYPSDPYQTVKLVKLSNATNGVTYIRTTREKTPILYSEKDTFKIGGSTVLKEDVKDVAVIFTAGITLHEALKAYEILKKDGIAVAIVDLYSVKPLDIQTIKRLSERTKHAIVVEDHYPAGGIGEAVSEVILSEVKELIKFTHLCVRKLPHSGSPEELLKFEEIDADAIVTAVKQQ